MPKIELFFQRSSYTCLPDLFGFASVKATTMTKIDTRALKSMLFRDSL